jgi:putative addiction module killer protein
MIELIKTDVFDRWLTELRDIRARARIEARIRRLSLGNPGDIVMAKAIATQWKE